MEGVNRNRMAEEPVKKLIWKLGLPMIVSMVLQAFLSVMMAGMNAILGAANADSSVLVGGFRYLL